MRSNFSSIHFGFDLSVLAQWTLLGSSASNDYCTTFEILHSTPLLNPFREVIVPGTLVSVVSCDWLDSFIFVSESRARRNSSNV